MSQFFDGQILISVMILTSFMSSLLMSSIKTFFILLLYVSMLFLAFLFHFSLECSFLFYVTHVIFLYYIFSIRIPNILIIIILYSHLIISTSLSYLSLLLMLNLFLQLCGVFLLAVSTSCNLLLPLCWQQDKMELSSVSSVILARHWTMFNAFCSYRFQRLQFL